MKERFTTPARRHGGKNFLSIFFFLVTESALNEIDCFLRSNFSPFHQKDLRP
jgi:hypothetical protein